MQLIIIKCAVIAYLRFLRRYPTLHFHGDLGSDICSTKSGQPSLEQVVNTTTRKQHDYKITLAMGISTLMQHVKVRYVFCYYKT